MLINRDNFDRKKSTSTIKTNFLTKINFTLIQEINKSVFLMSPLKLKKTKKQQLSPIII